MSDRKDFLSEAEGLIKKYKKKIEKVEKLIHNHDLSEHEEITSKVESIKKHLWQAEQSFEKLVSASKDEFEEIKDASSEIFHAVKEALKDLSRYVSQEQIAEAGERASNYLHEQVEALDEHIHKNPLKSVLWALGIGFMLGTLMRRSR